MLSKGRHQKNLRRVIAKAVGEQDLHMVSLCEVGGHKQGLEKSIVRAQDLVSQVLTRHYKATSCQAYMATWQAEDEPTDDTSVTLTLVGDPEVFELPSTLEPRLVIMAFTIAAAAHRQKRNLLISRNLHIRTPHGEKPPSVTEKTRITKAALKTLEQRASTASRALKTWGASSGAAQPAAPVIVLTGDVNLVKSACDGIVQPEKGELPVETQWQVMTSTAERSGDVLFVKGALGEAFDVSVGVSYDDRGMRNDSHDFFGVALSIPMTDKNPRGQKRQQVSAGGATQRGSKEQRQVHRAAPEDPQDKRATPGEMGTYACQNLMWRLLAASTSPCYSFDVGAAGQAFL